MQILLFQKYKFMKFIILNLKVSKSLYINHEFENDLENCLLKKIYCQAFSDISYL